MIRTFVFIMLFITANINLNVTAIIGSILRFFCILYVVTVKYDKFYRRPLKHIGKNLFTAQNSFLILSHKCHSTIDKIFCACFISCEID